MATIEEVIGTCERFFDYNLVHKGFFLIEVEGQLAIT